MDNQALLLSQWQFAITSVYHFFFVPLTLGLSVLVALMETIYVRTGNDLYLRMTKFWGKLFVINFAMGVVTGIVQEFQFGMNWSEYARYVGDVFGAPLAIEALLAFFIESTFLGVWIFGWDRLSRGMHALSMWLVALASNLSAFWILVANSFMQAPVGYAEQSNRLILKDFAALLTNRYVWGQFPHTVFSGFTTAAFFVLGISAYHLLRKRHEEVFRRSFQIATVFGIISIFMVILIGHTQAQRMVEFQPMKIAAAEALLRTENPASFSLLSLVDQSNMREIISIRIPRVLSLLAYNRLDGEVKGVIDLQQEYQARFGPGYYVPDITVTYWSFRLMVGSGFLMFFLAAYALWRVMRREVMQSRFKLLNVYPLALFLPYLANISGWLLTEMGRQPWVVYGKMRTADAVSPNLSGSMVLTTLIGFTLVYGLLMLADIYLLAKYAKAGPEPKATGHPLEEQVYWE
ncbi:cytochrome ubiquinol oxidase subunit I [Thermanaerothrix sp. 4228-RoL]|uniref:Cytochrome ubiquinol oxidase subunit I n=1 Tax=Thermanaerothrix solaris TaxID=3058434 RepID=A0ABU3NII5_9CHLR|nr:cytochrome ubiquinol oxidase subunit I [Thermanaerothrix sp. 4228-RoL]MDT8896668.1 cytochrome ubiquinol oxidase subunit I [Thermanaerothrix sp. 4228-RoL]